MGHGDCGVTGGYDDVGPPLVTIVAMAVAAGVVIALVL